MIFRFHFDYFDTLYAIINNYISKLFRGNELQINKFNIFYEKVRILS